MTIRPPHQSWTCLWQSKDGLGGTSRLSARQTLITGQFLIFNRPAKQLFSKRRLLCDELNRATHPSFPRQNAASTIRRLRSPAKRAALDQLLQYMGERRDMIRYPEFQQKHWQIGSGPTEAECKTTTHRVKGRGRRWNPENAEGMMALAALHDSGLWQQRWTTLEPSKN